MNLSTITSAICSVFIASVASAGPLVNVTKLNQTLQKKNATWIAKETWLSNLTKAEAKRMMGLKEVPTPDFEFAAPASLTRDGLPASVDWRNKDGRNWVSPILNQGNCGSCVAFAAVGVMETQFNISSLLPDLNLRLSTQNLFACGGGGCDSGWFPSSAASRLLRNGVTDEACAPYVSGATGEDMACSATCADVAQRNYKISNYSTPTNYTKNLAAVKRALQSGPLMTTLTVYADFMSYSSGVYKHTSGEQLGGHAVSIVGYDDATQSFIIRNSWGPDWGEQGFAHISYEDTSGIGRSTWLFDVPSIAGAVSIITPRDYTYVSGEVSFTGQSTFANTDSISYSIFGAGKAVWASSCQADNCSVRFDSASLPDGRYEIQAIANNAHGEKIGVSTRQFFYVVNQAPALELSFKGAGNLDLSRPLSERVEFAITTKSSSVPMSSIEFHYKDSNGKEVTRVANVVLDHMTSGWRTNLVPNGTYEIWMVGRVKSNSMNVTKETEHIFVKTEN